MSEFKLTQDEASIIAELIDVNLFNIIRSNKELDSMTWLRSVFKIYDKLAEYCGYISIDMLHSD